MSKSSAPSNYRLCSKCGKVFKNYAKPDTCIFCGTSEFVSKIDEANRNGYRDRFYRGLEGNPNGADRGTPKNKNIHRPARQVSQKP